MKQMKVLWMVKYGYLLVSSCPKVSKTYVIKYYNTMREVDGNTPVPYILIWTDNYLTQYKCHQYFLSVATIALKHTNNPDINPIDIYKFAHKCRFKRSWDEIGKIIKERIHRNSTEEYLPVTSNLDKIREK